MNKPSLPTPPEPKIEVHGLPVLLLMLVGITAMSIPGFLLLRMLIKVYF